MGDTSPHGRQLALEEHEGPATHLRYMLPMAPPTHVQDLATACVASVKAVTGIELDYSDETLPLLDHYTRSLFEESKEMPSQEILTLVAPMCGAYFGEVARRRFGTLRWHAPPEQYAEWRLEGERVFVYFNPIGLALEVLTEADAPGWNAHMELRDEDRQAVEHAVELFGSVRESDYYSFAVRFETLDQVMEALVRETQRRREEQRSYGSDTYRRAAAERRADAS